MKKLYNIFLLLTFFILIFTISVSSQFVQVSSGIADIRVRVLPETESRIVGEAIDGDIFRYISEEGNWIEIEMFSGDPRYIHNSMVEVLNRGISAPFSKDVCTKLVKSLEEAKIKTFSESNSIFQNILLDRYYLEIFHEFNLQPAIYPLVIGWCDESNKSESIQIASEEREGDILCVPTEKPEVYKEIFSENRSYDFRKANWGMSKEQVKLLENKKPELEEDNRLVYSVEIDGRDYDGIYVFLENKLYRSQYTLKDKYINKDSYIDEYKRLKELLTKNFGKPKKEGDISNIYSSNLTTWETSTTRIDLLILNDLLIIGYESKELKKWADKIKEEKRVNSIVYTEQKILEGTAELENQPESEIKIMDWTNRISESGNYYYVEGKVKNISNVVAKSIRVKIEALDIYGKLVSLEESYVDPSSLKPNQTGFFSVMVNYSSNIKKFSLNVYWK